MARRTLAHAALAVSATVVVACGGGEPEGGTTTETVPANPDLVIVAPGGLKFDAKEYTIKAGPATMLFRNEDGQVHNAVVKDTDGKVVGGVSDYQGGGDEAGATLDLTAGTYRLVCTVPGHEAAGMRATLTAG